MDALTTIIVSTIAGLAVLAIAGIYKRFFPRKTPKSISQKTIIKGDGNTVNNTIEDKEE